MKKASIILILFLMNIGQLKAQKKDSLNHYLNILLNLYEKGENTSILENKVLNYDFNSIESFFRLYERSANRDLQYRIFYLYSHFIMVEKKVDTRKSIVNTLLRSCGDSLQYRYGCWQTSMELTNEWYSIYDFDESAKKRITTLINIPYDNNSFPESYLVLLAGFLDLKECKNRLYELSSDTSKYNYKWEASLALARLGDKKMTQICLNKIRENIKKGCSMSEEDCLLSEMKFISYIKQPEVLPIYEFLLFSENFAPALKETQNHGPAYAYYAIGLFEQNIQDFPKLSDLIESHELRIKKGREWYKSNKDKIKFNTTVF